MIRDQFAVSYGIDEGDSLVRVYLRYALKRPCNSGESDDDIAAVLTVAVSLSLVGSALLLKQSAAQASRSGSRALESPSGWSPPRPERDCERTEPTRGPAHA